MTKRYNLNLINLRAAEPKVGLWQTEMGQLNEVVHLWAYRDLNHRGEVRGNALKDPEWQKFLAASAPLLVEMRSVILNPTAVSPMR